MEGRRFYSLDVLRGFAALSVVVFHWFFWYLTPILKPRGFDESVMPLYPVLFLFYEAGGHAVDLFFCISGFIFYWLYRDAVHAGAVSAWRFGVLRFSRLYPLHLATLLLVALGQLIYNQLTGHAFVFAVNDWEGFWKHVAIVPLWEPERTYSFNGPIWTLVVEAFLYTVFFLAARWARLNAAVTFLLIFCSSNVSRYSPDLGFGMAAFFAGGMTFLVYERVKSSEHVERALRILLCALWPFTVFCISQRLMIKDTEFWWLGAPYGIFFLFPCTILYLALLETRREGLGQRIAWVGDLSYSSYLLHFPLMLAFAVCLKAFGVPLTVFHSAWALIGFLALLVPLSLASNRYFERPVQRWLRDRVLRHDAPRAAPVPESARG
jgi:peptidoglycan/LPS O-acetylase OafA/YrhL